MDKDKKRHDGRLAISTRFFFLPTEDKKHLFDSWYYVIDGGVGRYVDYELMWSFINIS